MGKTVVAPLMEVINNRIVVSYKAEPVFIIDSSYNNLKEHEKRMMLSAIQVFINDERRRFEVDNIHDDLDKKYNEVKKKVEPH